MENKDIYKFLENEIITSEFISELNNLLLYYSEQYYNNAISVISDKKYDLLFNKLKDALQLHPEWKPNKCVVDNVGIEPTILDGFNKINHSEKLYSLDNTYNKDDVIQWIERIKKLLNVENFKFY